METLILGILLPALFFLAPFSLGLIGMYIEKKHFESLAAREKEYSGILMSNTKRLPPNWKAKNPVLVTGQVVIATDYLKVFLSSWRKIFGGRMGSYEKMVERARREAVLRMQEQAAGSGANVIWNVCITTITIQDAEANKSAGIEVLAYGTAMRVE